GGFAADSTGAYRLDDIGAFWGPATTIVDFDPTSVLKVHMVALLPTNVISDTVHFTESFGTTTADPLLSPAPKGLVRPAHDTLVIGNLDATVPEQSCLG